MACDKHGAAEKPKDGKHRETLVYNRDSFRDDTAPEYEGDEFERFVESRFVSSEHGW